MEVERVLREVAGLDAYNTRRRRRETHVADTPGDGTLLADGAGLVRLALDACSPVLARSGGGG